jgi:hypothetical protein
MKLGVAEGKLPLGQAVWTDTTIDAAALTRPLTNVLTGETVTIEDGRIRVSDALRCFPGAVLTG